MAKWTAAQAPAYNFHKLGLQDGLHDGAVRCIGQDKLGYVWVGTAGALNRYNGSKLVKYTSISGDSTSPLNTQTRTIHSDSEGRFWVGYENGMVEYNFQRNNFRREAAMAGKWITQVESCGDTALWVGTRAGLLRFNKRKSTVFNYSTSSLVKHAALFETPINSMCIKGDQLYLATQKGLVILNATTDEADNIPLPGIAPVPVFTIAADAGRNLWMGTFYTPALMRLSADFKTLSIYDTCLQTTVSFGYYMNVMSVLVDAANTPWVATANDGILHFDSVRKTFIAHRYNSQFPTGPSGNNYWSMFQDDRQTLWLGTSLFGVNFIDPRQTLFRTLMPMPAAVDNREQRVGRAIAEDKQGNLWMGNHDGVSRYNVRTKQYTVWRNEKGKKPQLYDNVVRTLYCDEKNNVWVGTAQGINRFNSTAQQMEFISPNDLPTKFYNSINGDSKGNVWFCVNDTAVLYWYNYAENRFNNIAHHPLLKPYQRLSPTSYVLEDSKGRLWISFSRRGVIMADMAKNKVLHLQHGDTGKQRLIGNQVIDIKEDKNGFVWMSTFNGISGYNVERDSCIAFDIKTGLPGNWVSPLLVDERNRLWIGVNGGLTLIDSARQNVTTFNINDGLSSVGFPEHAGIRLHNGDFMMPTFNGFLQFNPQTYTQQSKSIRFYTGSYEVSDTIRFPATNNDGTLSIQLAPHENAFTINLEALEYINQQQAWFAYTLKGLDREWHYTRDAKAVYTNVPGGSYTFLFKAALANNNWEAIEAKSISIHIQNYFYNTWWFKTLAALMIATAIGMFYRYRMGNQHKILLLQTKASALEREKATIQYDSLKQQLNPHFLFNSLASLRSLIKSNAPNAAPFLDALSKVYRYVLRSGEKELVTLQEELSFVQTFMDVQKVRFEEGLMLHVNVNAEDEAKMIVPVTLQNLMENAIKHNTTAKDAPLVIEVFCEDNYVVVRNNLQRYKMVEGSNKSGLKSMQKLYSFYTDKPIIIEDDDKYFTLKIPLL